MTSAITLISAAFDHDLSAQSDQSGQPANALGHVAGSEAKWASSGLPRRLRSIRSWLTFWPNETIADQFLAQRIDHIPLLKDATDVVVGLLHPFATHGDVNWIGGQPNPLNLDLAPRPEKAAPVFVITSAGIGTAGLGAVAFGQGTYKVRKTIREQNTLRFETQILPDSPLTDGPTLSLWDNLKAVMSFAYQNDPHKSAMAAMNHDDILRGSFTRCAVKSFSGVWQGRRIDI